MITTILISVALFAHLIMDLHKRKVGHPIVHWISAAVAVGVSVIVGFANQYLFKGEAYWQFAIYSLSVHFALFDPVWNLCNGQNIFYSGDPKNPSGAWTDKLWRITPTLAQPFIRAWVIAVGYAVYYNLDLIINN